MRDGPVAILVLARIAESAPADGTSQEVEGIVVPRRPEELLQGHPIGWPAGGPAVEAVPLREVAADPSDDEMEDGADDDEEEDSSSSSSSSGSGDEDGESSSGSDSDDSD